MNMIDECLAARLFCSIGERSVCPVPPFVDACFLVFDSGRDFDGFFCCAFVAVFEPRERCAAISANFFRAASCAGEGGFCDFALGLETALAFTVRFVFIHWTVAPKSAGQRDC